MKKLLVILLVALCLSSIFGVISPVKAEDLIINPTTAPQEYKPQESRYVYAGSDVLVIQDAYTWGMEQLYNAPDAAACSDLGISHDVITSSIFKNTPLLTLQSYKTIVLMADQPQGFYLNLYSSKQKLADYVNSGGVLSAVVYRGWIGYIVTEQFLPGSVILNYEYCDDVDFDPTHFIISNPDRPVSLSGPWGYNTIIDNIRYASSFYFTNLPSGYKTVAKDGHGHNVFSEYSYGSGKVLAVGIPIQWFYRYKLGLGGTGCEPPWDGANNLKLLYNELLYQSGLITIKDRLLSAMDRLKEATYNDITFLVRLEAEMNAIAYLNLQFDTVRFIAKVIVDLASAVTIGDPPDEVADLKSLQYLNTLSTVLRGPQYGVKGLDLGLCLGAADDYIKTQGLTSKADIENAYYQFIMGTASGQEKKMPFVQGSVTFNGLQELLNDIDADYQSFKTTLGSLTIPDTASTVELIQYLSNLRNALSHIITTPSVVNHISLLDNREFVCDSELGYLLNLKKQQEELKQRKDQAQLISDACLVTKGAMVFAKIVNVLALGTLTPIQIGVTLIAASASLVSTVSSSVELTAKTLIFGNKLQSIVQMGSENVHLKQILDDSESYVLWRMTYTPPDAKGTILEFVVPEVITDGMSGSQTGSVTIKNTGSSSVWAMAHIHILGPIASAENKMMVYFTAAPSEGIQIGAGSQETITFDYSVLDLSHIEGCNQYEARAYVSFEGKIIGPSIKFFKAGCACKSSSKDVLGGEISASETQSTYVTIGQGSVEAEFDLSYLGSDLDLHIYDQQGHHVGINYNTMQVEVNILGATYSGSSANPEWIKLPVTGGSVFEVAVAAVSVFGSESYTVTLTEFPSYHSPSLVLDSTHRDVAYGEETNFKVTLQNRGNVPDHFELTLTGLDETWYAFSQILFNLDPNEMTTALLTIHPSGADVVLGSYSFSVIATCVADPVIFDHVDASINVVVLDATSPKTVLTIGEPKYIVGSNIYVTPSASLTLTATDNPGGTGVSKTAYRIYKTSYDTSWLEYSVPFYLTGLDDGAYSIDYNSTDNVGNVEATNTATVILDNLGPSVTIINPPVGWALQDGVTLMAEAIDSGSGVDSLNFSIREANGAEGIPVGFEDLPATYNATTGKWTLFFNTLSLPDGYYVVLARAKDNLGNMGPSTIVPYSIRNWAVIELLPASENNKAGRTMPVKFALRIAASVDPLQPFVYNEDLTIKIYATNNPSNILQTSTFGDTARDYRINNVSQLYITNFQTLKTLLQYTVSVYRGIFLIDSFNFKTVK